MKKYILIFALLLPIVLYFTPNILAQTTEENQKTSCNNKKNGDACTYEEINSTSGRGTGNSTSNKVTKNGFCDRVNGNNDVNNNSLTCRTGQTDWGYCVVEGDACLGETGGGRGGSARELGVCTKITSSGSPRSSGTTTISCDTTKKPAGTPGGFSPTTGATPSSTGSSTNSSATTTAGTVSYESYTNFPGVGRISSLCQLITALWYLGFTVLLTSVLGMFLWGGYIYVTAGVNAGKVNQAKEIFTNTITGLIIGLSIFIIINIINPGLLQGNCSIPSVGSGATIGGPAGPSNIIPKPGESVFPTTCDYEGPGPLQSFGAPRDGGRRRHAGIDFTPPSQSTQCPILAFRDGTVTTVYNGFIAIQHADGIETRYIHNSRNFVSSGQKVQAGQEIGKQGNVGTGAIHLHFEIYNSSGAVNPAGVLLDSSKNPDPSKVKVTGNPRSTGGGL